MNFPENPHISVILPVKNGLPYLKDAIAGLCAQTYKNFTLIAQDSVSTDGSLEYLKSLKTDFKIDLVSEPDGSLTIGYARCMKRIKGDLMVFAACDEVFDANAFERYVEWYRQHPDAIFIYGGTRILREDPEKGRVEEPILPAAFDLFDYVRLRMCPTTGGAFNKRVLGDDLFFDESLKSCPDFELVTRIALLYGPHRIIMKNALTMTARGDRSSMTFRAESHAQFAKDKTTIIDRLISGPLALRFEEFLRNYFIYSLHMVSANIVNEVAPDSEFFASHVKAAEECLPRTDLVGRLAHQSRLLKWDEDKGGVTEIACPHPSTPLSQDMFEVAALPLPQFQMTTKWVDLGARLEITAHGAVIDTVKISGFSAMLPLSVDVLDFEKNWYWVRVTAQTIKGITKLLLTGSQAVWRGDFAEMLIMHQKKMVESAGTEVVYLPLKACRTAAVVVANHMQNDASRICIQSMSVVSVAKASAISPAQKLAG